MSDAAAADAAVAAAAEPAPTLVPLAGLGLAAAASLAVALVVGRRMQRGLPAVDPRPHPTATWGGADVALVALVYVGLLTAAGVIVPAGSSLRLTLLADIVVKAVATLVGIGVLRAAGASWAALGIAGWRWPDDLRLAVGALALVVAPLLGLAAVLDRIVPYEHPVVTFLREHRDPVAVALVIIAAVVAAPIGEEFFFRRVLQGWLERRLPEAGGAAAIGLQAAAFAAAHLGHGLAAGPLFLFGIVLGVIAHATGSLAPCVILHALFNAVSVGLLLAAPAASSGGGG